MISQVIGNLLQRGLRRRFFLAMGAVALVWISFFDSHSLLRRAKWHSEANRLESENLELQKTISDLNEKIERGLSSETVEEIARLQYGMHRPGETVYHVETEH